MKNFIRNLISNRGQKSVKDIDSSCIVNYSTICRNCLASYGFRHSRTFFMPMSIDKAFRQKTEFEIGNEIENIGRRDVISCDNCGSTNIEVYDIEIDGTKIYAFENIVEHCNTTKTQFFILNIQKENGKCELKIGGTVKLDSAFENECLQYIKNINNFLDYEFVSHDKGQFNIVISSKKSNSSENLTLNKIERLVNLGVSYQEILETVKNIESKQIKQNLVFSHSDTMGFFTHDLSYIVRIKKDKIDKEIINFQKTQNCLTELIIFNFSTCLTIALMLKNQNLHSNISQLGNTLKNLPFSVGVPFKSVAEAAKTNVFNLFKQDHLDGSHIQVKSTPDNCFTQTEISTNTKQSALHFVFSLMALTYDTFRICEKYSWEGSETVGDFMNSSKFPFYNRYIEGLEFIGNYIQHKETNLNEDQCTEVLMGLKLYLAGGGESLPPLI